MTDLAFQARGNLNRTLTYRPHLRLSYYGMLAFAAVAALLVTGLALAAYINNSTETALIMFFGGMTAPIALLVEAHFFVRPLAFLKIKVHQHGLTLEARHQVTEIPFNDVDRVEFSHVPYLGGWFKLVMKSGRKHRFTVVLERSEYILEMLAALRPEVLNTEDMLKYRRTAVLSDHSWGRVAEKLNNKTGIAAKYLAVPLVLAGLWAAGMVFYSGQEWPSPGAFVKLFGAVAVLNLAVGFLVTFSVGEFLIVSNGRDKLINDPAAVQRDYAFEKRVERIAHGAHWLLAVVMLVFTFFRYQF